MGLLTKNRAELEKLSQELTQSSFVEVIGKVEEIIQSENITKAQLFYYLYCVKSIPAWNEITAKNTASLELMYHYEEAIEKGHFPDTLILTWVRLAFADAREQSKYQRPNLQQSFDLKGRVVKTTNNKQAALLEREAKKNGKTTNNYGSATREYDTKRKAIEAGEKEIREQLEWGVNLFSSKSENN